MYKKSMIFIRLLGFTFGIAAIFTACQTAAPALSPSSRTQGFGSADPLYALQSKSYALMNLEQAWAVTQGDASIKIAVIDNGIAPHSDLTSQWTTGTRDGGLNLIALNWAKIVPDAKDKIFDLIDSELSSVSPGALATLHPNTGTYFHGTHVAGILAASQNGVGGIGVCPNCRLVPIIISPTIDGVGNITDENLALAVAYAAGFSITVGDITIPGLSTPRARIINMSFSGKAECGTLTSNAIQKAARERSVVVVASAGNLNNSGSIQQASAMSPAGCPNVISVASFSLSSNRVSNFSNVGATLLAPGGDDITLNSDDNYFGAFLSGCNAQDPRYPGTNATNGILSTYAAPNQSGCYRYLHGTSMAAPMVSGVIGLMLSKEPNLTPAEVEQRLKSTATPWAVGLLVNAGAALGGSVTPPLPAATTPCDDPAGAACTFDARSLSRMPDGSFVESIASYGRIWNFDLNGKPSAGNNTDIRSVARYANGPCASLPAGQRCTFDTRTLFNYPGVGFVESITAYGKGYNYDINGNEWVGGGNGMDLRSVARFASGPCAFATSGQPCTFDTRTVSNYPGVGFLETITAYGKFWNFDINGNEWVGGGNGTDLRSVPRYASGPCASAPAGQPCTFDTLSNTDYPGVGYVQSITAYGKAYNFDVNGNPWAGNGTDLKSVPRFASALTSGSPPVTKTNINFPRYIDPCTIPYDVDLKCEITKNYTEVLSRRPDDAGLQYWLNVGMSGQTLRYQFAYSQEAANLIQIISKACLLRDADPALLSTWQNYMLRGGTIDAVASLIMISPEFYQKGSPCTLTSNIM